MPKINLIITEPIRPNKNVDYLNYLVNKFKTIIDYDVNIFLCYWEDNTIDAKKINNIDFIHPEKEPNDKIIFKTITSRTQQQKLIHPQIEGWTPRIYKLFYGIRKIVEYIDKNSLIDENDIVLRIRTDLYIEDCDVKKFNDIFINMKNDVIYNRLRGETCDWFSISTYKTFKKIWYIKDDNQHNDIIKNIFNAEAIVLYRSILNNINIIDIRNIITLCVCREFTDKNNIKLERYG